MAEDMPGAGATAGGITPVIAGEMAARVDRLPMSRMAWEIALLVQVGWACAASADGTAARLYPFVWLPRHVMTSFEYSVLYALETGISVLIGGYAIGGWWGVYVVHSTPALVTFFVVATVGTTLWQFSMWVYIPGNYPTRVRSLGTGWTDGVGHLGAWGGILLSGMVFTAAAPRGWIVLITIPGALLPAFMVAIFGKRQRRRTLEELAR